MNAPAEPPVVVEAATVEPSAEHEPNWRERLTRRNIAIGVIALWLLSGVYMVPADEQAVETRFGAVTDERVLPGFNYNWPWPIGSVYRLKVRQLQRVVVGGEIVDTVVGQADPLLSQFLTGDQNIIDVRTVVQYSISTPRDYLFEVIDPGPAVRNAVEAELGRQIASRTVDEVLTTEKVAIQEVVRQRAQDLLDRNQIGVAIASVNIEEVSAPPEAADAFRDVASARADMARIVNEAEGYANDILPRARGEAQQMLLSSEAYKERKVNEALGDAARFTALAREHRRNPGVTQSRLYLETMEEVLPRLKKTIVDERGGLDLTIVRRKPGDTGALESLDQR